MTRPDGNSRYVPYKPLPEPPLREPPPRSLGALLAPDGGDEEGGDYPPTHPKSGALHTDEWLASDLITDAPLVQDSATYYDTVDSNITHIPNKRWAHAGISPNAQTRISEIKATWSDFVNSLRSIGRVLNAKNFDPFSHSYVYARWKETPGRGGNTRCGPESRCR